MRSELIEENEKLINERHETTDPVQTAVLKIDYVAVLSEKVTSVGQVQPTVSSVE